MPSQLREQPRGLQAVAARDLALELAAALGELARAPEVALGGPDQLRDAFRAGAARVRVERAARDPRRLETLIEEPVTVEADALQLAELRGAARLALERGDARRLRFVRGLAQRANGVADPASLGAARLLRFAAAAEKRERGYETRQTLRVPIPAASAADRAECARRCKRRSA